MKSRIFLFMMLIVGTFVIPLNNYSFGDGILLYTVHQVSGSDAINTDTVIRERCFVHVQIDVYSAHHGIFHRNNPDKTFYPGDAFDYSVRTWKDGCGAFWQPCPIQSTPNNSVPNCPSCVKGVTFGSSSDTGTGEIDPGYITGAISLSKQAIAEQKVCHKTKSGWSCSWQTVSSSATQGIPGLHPNLTLDMWTVGEEFTENDGYTSRNLDESYYVWDAINVVHNPIYQWKNERVGTIFVQYEKIHNPLNLEDEFFCDAASCVNTMTVPGFKPWTGTFDYGGGNTVYNATSLDDIGEHEIKYIARLYNIIPQIDEFTSTIDELVVEYAPIYESYVYPALQDDGKTAFVDRVGYAIHYFGNESTNANPDDIPGIHEDRRSKINDYFYSTWGADPWVYDFIDGTLGASEYSDDIKLTWDEASDVGIITNEIPVGKSVQIQDDLIQTKFPGMTPFEVDSPDTANFLKAGYSKIKFDYDGLDNVVVDPILKFPRYENVTIYNTLESTHFAGHDVSFLTSNEYMYPENHFWNTIRVTALDKDGNVDETINLELAIISNYSIPGTFDIDEYLYDKILFDTNDDGFSQIITGLDSMGNDIIIVNGHDVYPLDNLTMTGDGSIELEKTRRILTSFTQYDMITNQTFDANDIFDVSSKYLLDTGDAIMAIPLTTSLQALNPYELQITANNGTESVIHTFEHPWYEFSVDYDYTLNMAEDNVLDIARDPANPRVLIYKYNENFGTIDSLSVNGIVMDLPDCFGVKSIDSCNVLIPKSEYLAELNIISTNMWGGKASVTLHEIEQLEPVIPDPLNAIFGLQVYDWVLVLISLMIILVLGYKVFKKFFLFESQ